MKKIITSTAVFVTAMTLSAQNNLAEQAKQDLINSFTLGGCVITQGGWTDNKSKDAKVDFAARSARMHVAGKVLDYAYMLQLEYTGVAGTAKESGPHIVDAWIEWQKFPEFKVKLGQQKRAFTFENPYHPMDIGFGTYSQCVSFIGGYADIVGEQLSHGRDVGLAISGDLVPQGDHNPSVLDRALEQTQGPPCRSVGRADQRPFAWYLRLDRRLCEQCRTNARPQALVGRYAI